MKEVPLARREMEANRYAIGARDCEEADKFIDAYLELKEKDRESGTSEFYDHAEGLMLAAIMCYARAFTKSQGTGYVVPQLSVDLSSVFENDIDKIKLHERIIEKRDKAAAHSDWEFRHTRLLEALPGQGTLRHHAVVEYAANISADDFKSIAKTMLNYFRSEMYNRDSQIERGFKWQSKIDAKD